MAKYGKSHRPGKKVGFPDVQLDLTSFLKQM